MNRTTLLVPLLAAAAQIASARPVQGATDGEQVLLRQLAPSVTVRVGSGEERRERVLYYFSPTANLGQGDEFEQGGAAHSSVTLAEGGLAELWASAHMVFDRLDPAGDVLRLNEVTSAVVEAPTRAMVLVLPGGVRAEFQGTTVDVRLEPGTLRVRNQGDTPVRLVGFLSVDRERPAPSGEGVLLLERGQQADLPLFRITPPLPGRLEDRWSELQLRHDGGFLLEPGSESLVLRPSPEGGPVRDDISVGGVHTHLAGERMLLVRSHRAPVLSALHDGADRPVGATGAQRAGSKTMTVGMYLKALEAGFTLDEMRLRGFVVPRAVLDEAEKVLSETNPVQAESPAETPKEQDG